MKTLANTMAELANAVNKERLKSRYADILQRIEGYAKIGRFEGTINMYEKDVPYLLEQLANDGFKTSHIKNFGTGDEDGGWLMAYLVSWANPVK